MPGKGNCIISWLWELWITCTLFPVLPWLIWHSRTIPCSIWLWQLRLNISNYTCLVFLTYANKTCALHMQIHTHMPKDYLYSPSCFQIKCWLELTNEIKEVFIEKCLHKEKKNWQRGRIVFFPHCYNPHIYMHTSTHLEKKLPQVTGAIAEFGALS